MNIVDKVNVMIQTGDKIQLKGKTKHGKNRIQHFGDEFWVSDIRDKILTTKHKGVPGPFAMIFSTTGDSRWISLDNDPDFEIVG